MARLLSINVGLPRDIAWRGRTVRTGIWKQSVQGRRIVGGGAKPGKSVVADLRAEAVLAGVAGGIGL